MPASLAWPGPGILGSRHGAGSVRLHGASLAHLVLLLPAERGASPAQGGSTGLARAAAGRSVALLPPIVPPRTVEGATVLVPS